MSDVDETFQPWQPLGDAPSVVHVEALHDDLQTLRLLLRGEDPWSRGLQLKFERVIAYRNINESYRLRTWNKFVANRAPTFATIENSAWIEWLRPREHWVATWRRR